MDFRNDNNSMGFPEKRVEVDGLCITIFPKGKVSNLLVLDVAVCDLEEERFLPVLTTAKIHLDRNEGVVFQSEIASLQMQAGVPLYEVFEGAVEEYVDSLKGKGIL